jgi:two-component system sensor histidine kinase KdpD
VVGFLVASIITSQIAARARHQTTQARLRQEETAALNHLNMAVLSVGQAETILDRLVREVAGNLNALTASIYLTEPEAPGQLEPAASFTRPGTPPPEGFRAEIIQLAFNKKEPLYRADGRLRQAYLPLGHGEESRGVLALLLGPAEDGDNSPEEFFDPAARRWLEILANQVALAVEHARLIRENTQVASLKETDRLKSALLASVSHELRTPLTAIKTALAGLQDEGVEPEEELEYKTIIDQETDRLNRLISNLLDLSRIEAGALKPNIGMYFFPEIINATLERLSRGNWLTGHPVTTNFEPDVPLAPVDYLEIDQVVTNLLENAAKYSEPGKPISIDLRQGGNPFKPGENEPGLLVEICDEGAGVPEAALDRIFDKFYRVAADPGSSLRSEVAGSGLGLAICKGIIEAHGGRIWAKPRLYGGSLFAFWLPLSASKTGELVNHAE